MYRQEKTRTVLMLFLLTLKCAKSTHYSSKLSTNQIFPGSSYWADILREFVFRTISPPPPGNNLLYKRILNAPFYGGPLPSFSGNESTVILSRGNVFYFPDDRWILCQEGCVDCEACHEQRIPTVRWTLRRIKRPSVFGLPRFDLQLTIEPQRDGSFHMQNLWPRSYIYVTTQTDQGRNRPIGAPGYSSWENMFEHVNDDVIDRNYGKSANPWRLVERNVEVEKQRAEEIRSDLAENSRNETRATVRDKDFYEKDSGDLSEQRNTEKNIGKQSPTRLTTEVPATMHFPLRDNVPVIDINRTNNADIFTPKLIFGTDHNGRKHIIHVIPAEDLSELPSMNMSSIKNEPKNGDINSTFNHTATSSYNNTSYEKLVRRVLISLDAHKQLIEQFFHGPKNRTIPDKEPVFSLSITKSNETGSIRIGDRSYSHDTVTLATTTTTNKSDYPQENKRTNDVLFNKHEVPKGHQSHYQEIPTHKTPLLYAPAPRPANRMTERRQRQDGVDIGRSNNKHSPNVTTVAAKSWPAERTGVNHTTNRFQPEKQPAPIQIKRKFVDNGFLPIAGSRRSETNGNFQQFDDLLSANDSKNRPRRIRIDPLHLPTMERMRNGVLRN